MNYKKLFELREYNELLQKDVAKLLCVKNNTYCEWEKGKSIIPLKHLHTLSKYYKVSLNYLMGLSEKNFYSENNDLLDKKIVGKNIKQMRINLKLTQQNLADLLNTTHSVISAYENGKTLILTAFLYQLCKEFNVSADKICHEKNNLVKPSCS